MKCPDCGKHSEVIESAADEEGTPVRRRQCQSGHRFATEERVMAYEAFQSRAYMWSQTKLQMIRRPINGRQKPLRMSVLARARARRRQIDARLAR
jgi:transcriptional regulator NrdR family protein